MGTVGSATTNPIIDFGGGTGSGVLDLRNIALSNFHGTLSNIGTGEGILVSGAKSVSLEKSGTVLDVFDKSGNSLGTLALAQDDSSDYFSGTATGEIVICFMPGTLIATPDGERAVETLAAGDLVLATDGTAKPIAWMGRQTVSRVFGDPLRVLPIRIEAGALDENLPRRDLLISPDHALLLGGVLIHAAALVNGTTIRRDRDVPEVFTYYHVELEDHALILAEGVPAETFVDNVDRMAFDNWDEHLARWPDGREIDEMPLPRAKSARQVPPSVRTLLAGRAAKVASAA
jgi:hypothetical protein